MTGLLWDSLPSLATLVVSLLGATAREPTAPSFPGRDIASRTVLADIVLLGRADRELPLRPDSPQGNPVLYLVRFAVHQVYKRRLLPAGPASLPPAAVTVGVFGGRTGDGANDCRQMAPRVAMESRYIVFLVAYGNDDDAKLNASSSSVAMTTTEDARTESFYRIFGCPEPVTKETSRQVKRHSCPKCGK